MNQEILAAQGRISNLKLEAKRLALEIEDHRQTLKWLIAPQKYPDGYDAERIPMRATQLAAAVVAYRAVKAEIAQLRDEYGLPE